VHIVLALAALFFIGVALYTLWLPMFRVANVQVEGGDIEAIKQVTLESLTGAQFLLIPKSSIFFLAQRSIRTKIFAAHPEVQAVSISATGLDGIRVKVHVRSKSFVWCGESVALPAPTCYEADSEGLVYAPTDVSATPSTELLATSTESLVPSVKQDTARDATALLVYGPLIGAEQGPLRAHVTYSSALPSALKFVKAMRSLGAAVVSITLRDDEIDLHTIGGTRITYVIGKEEQAAILAATAFPNVNLNDGSIEYVDLRFDNKVYLRRLGEGEG
jgi:cell division septal protein FtsQ